MSVASVGRLERVNIKQVWPHEEYDFTPWLLDNLDVLNDVIDVPIVSAEREQAAGTFSVDLVGDDESGQRVVIENQFGKTDHDHFGKLLTYLTAFNAHIGIWIAEDARPEHVAAISWLNQSTDASFYLLKVEALKIGNSLPAPVLTRIVGPSIEAKEVGATKQNISQMQNTFNEFWSQLLEQSKLRTPLHANIKPGREQWLNVSAGRPGLVFSYFVRQHDGQVDLYIDTGDATKNKTLFDQFFASRDAIEASFGEPLVWDRLDNRKGSRVRHIVSVGGYKDPEQWGVVQSALIDAMIRLEATLRPYIEQIPR